MEPRFPSTSASALQERVSIRRRSGGLSPYLPHEPSKSPVSVYSPSIRGTPRLPSISDHSEDRIHGLLQSVCASPGLTVQVEDADDVQCRPTVLLVQKPLPSPPLPALPQPEIEEACTLESARSPQTSLGFAIVPLTPRTQCPSPISIHSSQNIGTSPIPHLPTPDYSVIRNPFENVHSLFRPTLTKPKKNVRTNSGLSDTSVRSKGTVFTHLSTGRNTLQQVISVPLNLLCDSAAKTIRSISTPGDQNATFKFMNRKVPSDPPEVVSGASRPQSARSGSNISSVSNQSSSSIDSGRSSLLPSVGTTDKFTHRWPRPRLVHRLQIGARNAYKRPTKYDEETSLGLDDGTNLGIERIGRWTVHKWFLVFSVTFVFTYGAVALTYALLTWYRTWLLADVMCVADNDILILITVAAILLLLASLLGMTGTLLNSRPLLAVYAILLWPALLALLAVGYAAYKRASFALDRKLNLAWSEWYTAAGRLTIQNALACCGFYDATHEAVPSARCFPRTPQPGCKAPLLRAERAHLARVWQAAFALVPLHLTAAATALLCANHVTRRFGKGVMPRAYWLRVDDVRRDAHTLLQRFAEAGAEEGAARRPPLARAGSSMSCIRDDKEYTSSASMLLPTPEGATTTGRQESFTHALPITLRAGPSVGLGLKGT